MNDDENDPKVKANLHLEKAEGYRNLGLAAQVQHELAEAVRLDPSIINSARYHAFQEEVAAEEKQKLSMRSPLSYWCRHGFCKCCNRRLFFALPSGYW